MSNEIFVQYVGFEPKAQVREYTFNVREAGEVREFKVNIPNEAFLSRRAKYQDAPAICSIRLNAELAAHANHPTETQFVITGAELDSYLATRSPKISRGATGWKKAQENF